MTTPTREKVVQWAKEAGLDIMPGGLQFDWSERNLIAFASLARADLEATITEQAKEIERLKSGQGVSSAELELTNKLAASQAYAAQLREALGLPCDRWNKTQHEIVSRTLALQPPLLIALEQNL